MSCYFRHMKDIFDELGIEINSKNKKEIDNIIHHIVEVEYKNCSKTWAAVKEQINKDEKTRNEFINSIRRVLRKNPGFFAPQ